MTNQTRKIDLDSKLRSLATRIFKPQTDADHDLMWVAIAFFAFGFLIGG
ncbi:hypothetical protein [Paraurantiacibacter namhicola]|uniref:Uncharacterized protein n=1 Tax=Paraurantiacibacter namhicola TaxID=645517 RepID=A0A1C7D975_9SPHN|nr:hypothetical protein [Paraurantiacibacter namhicola]ANU08024.1 hypothetical protein A6F65_01727 [Paraurantiacibacter namhicola]